MFESVSSINQQVLTPSQLNAQDLAKDLLWCEQVIDTRFKLYFDQQGEYASVFDLTPPVMSNSKSCYAEFINRQQFRFSERLILVLALLPAVKPRVLDIFLCLNEQTNRPYIEFGCTEADGCIYATGETLAFILGGDNLAVRLQVQEHLQSKAKTGVHQLLDLRGDHHDALLMKTPLRITQEYLHLFTTAKPYRPDLSEAFPAQLVSSEMQWDDLVLPESVTEKLQEILGWIKYGEHLMFDWGLANKINPGYRALFYGPPGTGKTLTACLLGKSTGRDVYKVDLSLVVSKYIGETEKNLEKVFSLAEHKSWILFFDEADALFGKRIQTAGANDQFANQNVAYLLQRIEKFNGIAILASNFKDNFDQAFFRRFESIIYFPLPGAGQRLSLWQQGFSKKPHLDESIDLKEIADDYALSGAEIINVIRFASLKALCDNRCEIARVDIFEGIRRQQNANASEHSSYTQTDTDIFS